jgi:hypothetical protein
VGDITPLFDIPDDFRINSYQPPPHGGARDQVYNGGMFLMDAGARASVWKDFDPDESPRATRSNPHFVGTDQAWIRHHLGPDEKTWSRRDGVYEARNVGNKLPRNAKIIFFAGNRDPSTAKHEWIPRHWI